LERSSKVPSPVLVEVHRFARVRRRSEDVQAPVAVEVLQDRPAREIAAVQAERGREVRETRELGLRGEDLRGDELVRRQPRRILAQGHGGDVEQPLRAQRHLEVSRGLARLAQPAQGLARAALLGVHAAGLDRQEAALGRVTRLAVVGLALAHRGHAKVEAQALGEGRPVLARYGLEPLVAGPEARQSLLGPPEAQVVASEVVVELGEGLGRGRALVHAGPGLVQLLQLEVAQERVRARRPAAHALEQLEHVPVACEFLLARRGVDGAGWSRIRGYLPGREAQQEQCGAHL